MEMWAVYTGFLGHFQTKATKDPRRQAGSETVRSLEAAGPWSCLGSGDREVLGSFCTEGQGLYPFQHILGKTPTRAGKKHQTAV